MKTLKLLIIAMFIGVTTYAQIHEPVKWSTSVEKISTYEYYLVATATIENTWHLYSQEVPKDGPIPTSFTFNKTKMFKLVGSVEEEKGHTVNDAIFNMKIKYFDKKAVFKQRIKSSKGSVIKGFVEFMVCNDTQCLPPTEVDLEFEIK